MIIFITGGARSGKSDFAQDMAEKIEGKRLFLATAQAFDEEMEERIQKHREQRGDRWNTIEEPLYIGNAIRSVLGQYKTILVDCLTVWMSNLLMEYPNQNEKISEIVDDFFFSLDELEEKIIIVSNEVGMGIVPDNKLARDYRDRLGFLNQRMAGRADEVYALLSGIPVKVK
ncbi:MAG: bifunctional adenosylcobinamide kinase/adenosylcobinamide-phosphate guanylyltransferase [Deltaproteobacteria bacterium]|nr:bifunctional adenosylcobinamide kinase/adenosylcobinamide-phosphate guanylyltransferase [Deltaproteobacteria bacterium]